MREATGGPKRPMDIEMVRFEIVRTADGRYRHRRKKTILGPRRGSSVRDGPDSGR